MKFQVNLASNCFSVNIVNTCKFFLPLTNLTSLSFPITTCFPLILILFISHAHSAFLLDLHHLLYPFFFCFFSILYKMNWFLFILCVSSSIDIVIAFLFFLSLFLSFSPSLPSDCSNLVK